MGVSYGSCTGSTDAVCEFGSLMITGKLGRFNATTYLRMMSHTAAANIGLYFGLKGRVIPTCSECTSASQGIGDASESIKRTDDRREGTRWSYGVKLDVRGVSKQKNTNIKRN